MLIYGDVCVPLGTHTSPYIDTPGNLHYAKSEKPIVEVQSYDKVYWGRPCFDALFFQNEIQGQR